MTLRERIEGLIEAGQAMRQGWPTANLYDWDAILDKWDVAKNALAAVLVVEGPERQPPVLVCPKHGWYQVACKECEATQSDKLLKDALLGLKVLRAIGQSRAYKTVGKVEMPSWGKPVMETCEALIEEIELHLLRNVKVIQSAAAPSLHKEGVESVPPLIAQVAKEITEEFCGGSKAVEQIILARLWALTTPSDYICTRCQREIPENVPCPYCAALHKEGAGGVCRTCGAAISIIYECDNGHEFQGPDVTGTERAQGELEAAFRDGADWKRISANAIRKATLEEAAKLVEGQLVYTGPGGFDPEPIQKCLALAIRALAALPTGRAEKKEPRSRERFL